jgi:hypothetical protein
MKYFQKINLLVFSFLALTFSSCEKEGPVGPVGPTGATGATGENGNANVVSTIFVSTNWVYQTPYWVQTFTNPAITRDIVDRGAVLAYLQLSNGGYSQLPVTFYPDPSYSTSIEVSYVVGKVSLILNDSDQTQPNQPGVWTFKIVVISASGKMKNPNLDYSNYQEVVKAFEINE